MLLLREVFSIVLLFAPAATEMVHPPDTYSLHAAGEARQNQILLPLMKDALRLITGYIGSSACTGYEMPPTTLMIGIRG